MNSARVLAGVEFDWFAVDLSGDFAIFATAGSGPIPAAVRSDTSEHDRLGESIEASGFGTLDVWNSYSGVGLYVYDWSDGKGGYVRVGVPGAPPAAELLANLRSISNLPQLAVTFSQALSVSGDLAGDGT